MISCFDVYNGGYLANHLFRIGAAISTAKRLGLDYGVQANWCYRKYLRNRLPVISKTPKFFFQEHPNALLWDKNCSDPDGDGVRATYESLGRLCDDTDIYGFFGNEIFLKDAVPEIKELFRLSPDYEEAVQNKFDELTRGRTVCSVHVRRGDFVLEGKHLDCLYYFNAMDSVRDVCSRFLIFSDDPDYCRNVFRSDNCVVVEKGEDILDMFLMSLCHHHIVGNSTFSWWAAWMGEKEGKRIVVPQPWFHERPRYELAPARWIRISWTPEPGRKRSVFRGDEDDEARQVVEDGMRRKRERWESLGVTKT